MSYAQYNEVELSGKLKCNMQANHIFTVYVICKFIINIQTIQQQQKQPLQWKKIAQCYVIPPRAKKSWCFFSLGRVAKCYIVLREPIKN